MQTAAGILNPKFPVPWKHHDHLPITYGYKYDHKSPFPPTLLTLGLLGRESCMTTAVSGRPAKLRRPFSILHPPGLINGIANFTRDERRAFQNAVELGLGVGFLLGGKGGRGFGCGDEEGTA